MWAGEQGGGAQPQISPPVSLSSLPSYVGDERLVRARNLVAQRVHGGGDGGELLVDGRVDDQLPRRVQLVHEVDARLLQGIVLGRVVPPRDVLARFARDRGDARRRHPLPVGQVEFGLRQERHRFDVGVRLVMQHGHRLERLLHATLAQEHDGGEHFREVGVVGLLAGDFGVRRKRLAKGVGHLGAGGGGGEDEQSGQGGGAGRRGGGMDGERGRGERRILSSKDGGAPAGRAQPGPPAAFPRPSRRRQSNRAVSTVALVGALGWRAAWRPSSGRARAAAVGRPRLRQIGTPPARIIRAESCFRHPTATHRAADLANAMVKLCGERVGGCWRDRISQWHVFSGAAGQTGPCAARSPSRRVWQIARHAFGRAAAVGGARMPPAAWPARGARRRDTRARRAGRRQRARTKPAHLVSVVAGGTGRRWAWTGREESGAARRARPVARPAPAHDPANRSPRAGGRDGAVRHASPHARADVKPWHRWRGAGSVGRGEQRAAAGAARGVRHVGWRPPRGGDARNPSHMAYNEPDVRLGWQARAKPPSAA